MITTFLFDLDGTLVQTEILKAISYARAAVQLRPADLTEAEVIAAFGEVVGLSRQDVVKFLMKRFELEESAKSRMVELDDATPEEAYVHLRLHIYEEMLSDHQVLYDHLLPHNTGLLQRVKSQGYRTGLATMSHGKQARRVLDILRIAPHLDEIATRDEVTYGKPNPEIYYLVARRLGVTHEACLVIEDSASGVKAALNAGMGCIAVTTDLTRASVHDSGLLDLRWIVDDPGQVETVVDAYMREQG
ncbi:MAG: HAD family phosphatase [candidate division Zixibacteria bacterium]|nr:HAD family phosphatase [candidate division Zixibacteria bacterium]